jgi:hypothetical protein
VVQGLLDRSTYPLDRLAEVDAAWTDPPEAFVRAVYGAALERQPADREIALWTAGAAAPGWRLGLVEAVTGSGEARRQGTAVDWVQQLRRRRPLEADAPAPRPSAAPAWRTTLRAAAARLRRGSGS